MSVLDNLRADRAALDREIRREGWTLVFAAIGGGVGFLALAAALPLLAALLRRFWAYFGVM